MTDRMQALQEFIRDELGYEGTLNPETDLLDDEVLDSFSIVELAVFVQDRLGVELDADDLSRENFTSLSTIVSLIDVRSS